MKIIKEEPWTLWDEPCTKLTYKDGTIKYKVYFPKYKEYALYSFEEDTVE